MVSSDRGAGATAVVSIHEEKNMEVEIPRYDPKDKPKLWISKVEIHHNTMMIKIRGLVQVKLFEQVASNDDFFKGIEDVTIDLESLDGQQKLESKEDIILAKKAQMLNDLLNAIMELPKDEILSFLTSSSLPSGIHGSSEKTPEKEPEPTEPENPENSAIPTASGSNEPGAIDTNAEDFNWILDCGDSWKDLPAVVRVNAIQLGYNQKLWDEDAQDLPVFQKLWKDLTPNQRTAAVFLGNYDEEIWNEDARILMMAASMSSIEYDEDLQTAPSAKKPDAKEDATVATASTDMSVDRFDNEPDDDDDDDDDMFSEFVSNFVSDTNKEAAASTDLAAPQTDETEGEDSMMDEFLSNFAVTPEVEKESSKSKMTENPAKASNVVSDIEEDEDEMMDEFLSNFVESAKDEDSTAKTESNLEKENAVPSTSISPDNNEDEEAMMDDLFSNFADSANEKSGSEKHSLEAETSDGTTSVVPKKEDEEDSMMDEFLANFAASKEDNCADNSNEKNVQEQGVVLPTHGLVSNQNNDDDDDLAMMDEFVSNFVAPNDGSSSEKENLAVPTKSLVSNYESFRENSGDEEQPLVSKPKEYIMDRGFQGEGSPLLPSTKEASETEPQTQKPEEPSSTWDTVSSYLYWIPVVIGLPVAYMLATGAQNIKS